MLSPELAERLVRVGPGTPMGALLRRYWMPAAASCELRPGAVLGVRLLGEDLALFRTAAGATGLVEAACPHRGVSLRHGRVDGEGLRCAYHGWRFATDGACLEVPFAGASPREHLGARAYRTEELGGLVFAYLGPEPAPLLPRYDVYVWEDALRDVGRAVLPCNWLQIMENSVDPTHVEWLHGHHLGAVRAAAGASAPAHYGRRHERIGFEVFRHGIVKRRVLEGGSEADGDWTVGHPLVFPIALRVGAGGQHRMQIRVPVDDTHTAHYWYSCYLPAPGREVPPQREVPLYEVPFRDERGEPLTDFVDGGDVMAWLSQGAIADRTREKLVASDEGVVLYRKLLLAQIERVERGEDPLGIVRDPAENGLIELPQERDKYGDGRGFLAESMALSHVRYSPLRAEIERSMGLRDDSDD